MLRRSAVASAVLVLLFGTGGEAQTPPPTAAPTASAPAKPAAKKPAAKTNAGAKPPAPADSGRCQVGAIIAAGDVFTVQKAGLTVFGNEFAEVPVKWGFDDLILDRVRAAAAPMQVRRISYARDAFDSYYHPKPAIFRNAPRELAELVKQIVGNAGCERYVVITRANGRLNGTNQDLVGIGVLSQGVGVFSRSYVFANMGVVVLDGATFEARRNPHLTLEAGLARIAANLTKSEYLHELDKETFKFPESPSDAADNTMLRDSARRFVAERLDKYLPAYFKQQ